MTITRRGGLLALASATAVAGGAAAQDAYPTRAVELVVPSAPGGGTDVMTRAFAEAAKAHSPQPFVVNNRPGASGAIGMGEVLNARPDGYKVSVVIAELAILPALNQIRFGPEDFRMAARLNADPAAIAVRSDAPWRTLEDFIAAAKRSSEAVKVGNSGVGSIWHLAAAALGDKVGAKFLDVPFGGSGPSLLALISGQIDAVCCAPGEATPHIQGGRLRLLGITADARLPAFAEVPTMKERGVDVTIGTWRGLGVPRATPAPVVARIAEIARATSAEASFRDAMGRASLGLAFADGPAFEADVARDKETFARLVRTLGIS